MSKPDILLIILDTLRRDRLSVYGHTRPTSPGFDEFAARSTLFERAVAPSQWTIPAHSSIFTGLYPSAHGVIEANGQLSPTHPTLAEILQVGGYHTVAFCNNPLVGALDNGLQRGFDAFYNYASAVPNRPNDPETGSLRRHFRRWFRPYARRIGNHFAQSDELFRVSLHPLLTPIWSKYINFKGNTARSIDDLIGYWDAYHQGGTDQPLFTFVNLMGAHLPYHPPQDVMNRIAPELRSDRAAYRYMNQFNADAASWASPPETPFSEWQRVVLNGFYDAEIAYQDHYLNKLLNHLLTTGALDHTCVIVAADHGEGHGEHDLFGHSFNVYQELVHVPLAIHAPDFAPGQHVSENVSTRRLFHTILDLAGMTPPLDENDPNANVAGLSLLNALKRSSDSEGGLAFSEAFPPSIFLNVLEHNSPALVDRLRLRQVRRAVYDGDHKLVMREDQVEGLFDVANDPAETRDLTADQPKEIEALEGKVKAFVETMGQPPDVHTAEADAKVIEQLKALGYIE
ncbi:MAG TPA: sulfatase [Phototrophicaceae bacterium]|nr:sulfatase [Phototrophicaceae bacterium]